MALSSAPSCFSFLRDWFAELSPVYWYFWIGLLLVAGGFVFPPRHFAVARNPRATAAAAMTILARAISFLRRATCTWLSAASLSSNGLNFELGRGERHAIIGPNGAGKTTFVSLVTGLLTPNSGDVVVQRRGRSRSARRSSASRPASRARSRSIRCFAALNPLESIVLALCERDGRGGLSLHSVARETTLIDEAMALLAKFGLAARCACRPPIRCLMASSGCWRWRLPSRSTRKCCCSTSPRPACQPQQGHELFAQLSSLTAGTTVLFIEHDMNIVFRYADMHVGLRGRQPCGAGHARQGAR